MGKMRLSFIDTDLLYKAGLAVFRYLLVFLIVYQAICIFAVE